MLKGIMEKRRIFRQTKKTPPPNLVPTDLEPPISLLAGETIGMLRKIEMTKTTKNSKKKKARILREKKKLSRKNMLGHFNAGISLGTVNTRSCLVPARLGELITECDTNGIGLLAVTEHRLHLKDCADPVKIDDKANGVRFIYGSAEKGELGANVGGVGLLISPRCVDAYDGCSLPHPRVLHVKFLARPNRVNPNNTQQLRRVHQIVVYFPTAAAGKAAREKYLEVAKIVSQVVQSIPLRDTVVVSGDFNATVKTDPADGEKRGAKRRVLFSPREKQNLNAPALRKMMDELDLYPVNSRLELKKSSDHFTFFGPKKRRARLDYIMVRGKWAHGFTSVKVQPLRNITSDHRLVIVTGTLKLRRKDQPIKHSVRLDFSILGQDSPERQTTSDSILEMVGKDYLFDPGKSHNDNCIALTAVLKVASSTFIPQMTKHKKRCPWEDAIVVELRRQRHEAQENYKRIKSRANLRIIMKIGKQLKPTYEACLNKFISDQCSDIEGYASQWKSDAAFRLLNQLTHRRPRTRPQVRGTPEEVLEKFRAHFEKVSMASPRQTPLDTPFASVLGADARLAYNVGPITCGEVEAALKTTGNRKAPGCDEIPSEIWKIPGLAPLMVEIMNQCLEQGSSPEDWHTLLVCPVPKKGDLSLPTNYRGISLMCVIAKVYNKVILHRLRETLEPVLLHTQNGFRVARGTEAHIAALRELIRYSMGKKDTSLVICFIDFSKAFDSVEWDYMEACLIAYQLPALLVKAIMSLYKGALGRVRTCDGISEIFMLCRGVLQGDTLAPFLFDIVADYIIRKAIEKCPLAGFSFPTTTSNYRLRSVSRTDLALAAVGNLLSNLFYADDSALLAGGTQSYDYYVSMLEEFVQAFEAVARFSGLEFNVPKCDTVAIKNGDLQKKGSVTFRTLDGKEVKSVSDFSYLGSLLVSEANDIRKRLGQAQAATKEAIKIWKSMQITQASKAMFFTALVVSIATYGGNTWVTNEKTERSMQGKFTRMVKLAMGHESTAHVNLAEIYKLVLPIQATLRKRRLSFIGTAYRTRSLNFRQVMFDVFDWVEAMCPHTDRQNINLIQQTLLDYNEVANRNVYSFAIVRSVMLDKVKWQNIIMASVKKSKQNVLSGPGRVTTSFATTNVVRKRGPSETPRPISESMSNTRSRLLGDDFGGPMITFNNDLSGTFPLVSSNPVITSPSQAARTLTTSETTATPSTQVATKTGYPKRPRVALTPVDEARKAQFIPNDRSKRNRGNSLPDILDVTELEF